MATENLKERKIYRILTNATSKAWDKIAFWTTAKSVDAADGNNLETKVGAIKGITTSTNTTTKGYAADATVIKKLNDSLGGCKLVREGGDFFIVGADSVRKKLGNSNLVLMNGTSYAYTGINNLRYSQMYLDNIDFTSYSKIQVTNLGTFNYEIRCGDIYITTDGIYDISHLGISSLRIVYYGNVENNPINLKIELIG